MCNLCNTLSKKNNLKRNKISEGRWAGVYTDKMLQIKLIKILKKIFCSLLHCIKNIGNAAITLLL